PLTPLIRRLLAEALHRSPQDIDDNAQFLTLGLDSLSAVDLARRLERELGHPLPATLLFEHRTIAELATHLTTTSPPAQTPPPPPPSGTGAGAGAGTHHPLTPLQLAFHTTETLHDGITAYGYLRQTISGPLDTALLGRTLTHLTARHPMLRMRITDDGGPRPHQSNIHKIPIRTMLMCIYRWWPYN
ncbi:acyl carrier protein, partial [Streptomyces brasiliscabiei]|uniref:acyl carrier protein n=1 Tax=Streptomyces brasiliscabiei TaxID=2736302 RepID=UPI001C108E7C